MTATPTVTRIVTLGSLHLEHKFFKNPRAQSGLDDAALLALGEDIKKHGLIEIPKVQKVKHPTGTAIDLLWDGQRRVKAMLKVFPADHPIEVIDRTEDPIDLDSLQGDALLMDALRTTNRTELSSHELAEVAFNLRDHGKYSLKQIGEAIGRDASWVSKILTAREAANPKLMAAWQAGQIPDEMFKDLAALSPKDQSNVLESVLEVRESGDAAEARTRVKELKEKAKQIETSKKNGVSKPEPKDDGKASEPAETSNGKNGHKPVVSGDQQDMWQKPPAVKPVKKDRPAMAILEDLLEAAKDRPPTHDFVKGAFQMLRYVTGAIEQEEIGKAFSQYIDRLSGKPKAAKKATAKKAKPAKKSAGKKKSKK